MLRTLSGGLLLLALAGCGSEEGSASAALAVRVDGTWWRAPASEGVVVYSGSDPEGAGYVYTAGLVRTGSGNEFLSLDLPNPPAVGTYSLGGTTAFATFLSCPAPDAAACAFWSTIPSDPGTVSITAIDTAAGTIAGTFSFRGHFSGDSAGAVKTFSGGQFVIRFAPVP